MATNTTNYNLKKPAASDFYNVEDSNGNMDIIDAELKAVNDKAEDKVAKVTGKGLTENEFTDVYKNKLDGIAAGAQVNRAISDSVTSTSSTTAASSKAVKAANDNANNKVTKVAGKELSENDFTDALKTKLDGIAAGAQVNRGISDSVTSTSSSTNASSKAVKTTYDKANHGHPYASNTHAHDERYYTEDEIDTKLGGKSDTTHDHDDAYLGKTANAASASKLATARTISLGGDASGSISFNGTINKTLEVTVKDDSHTHHTQYYTKTQIDAVYHIATNISVNNTGWVASNDQYYKDVSDAWFNGASDEYVNVVPSQASYTNALVLTGRVDTLSGKIRIWAVAVPSGTITINYQAQRGV